MNIFGQCLDNFNTDSMRSILLTAFFLVSVTSYSQISKSRGLPESRVSARVYLNGVEQHERISKSDLAKYDLIIRLSDASYKVEGFTVAYNCHSGALFDVAIRDYLGDKIKAGDRFMMGTWVGDALEIFGFVLEHKGKKYTSADRVFWVVE
jgi:hypothetical protein